jgi:hypothetical protein
MDISETTVKVMFIVASALVALVVIDARWLGPWRAARRKAKQERAKL